MANLAKLIVVNAALAGLAITAHANLASIGVFRSLA